MHFYTEKDRSLGQIAKELDVSKDFVANTLRDGGVQLRKRGGDFERPNNPPYGWRKENGKILPHLIEQGVIRKMETARANGKTLRAIVRDLEKANIKTKSGGKWHSFTVGKILKENPLRIKALGEANPFETI